VSEADPQARPDLQAGALFISYASADRAVADELTAFLEQRGVRCWIAPRDVPPGALYADAIVRAINEARALVVILSHNSTGSSHVGKELERASSKRRPIIAVRIDAAQLTPAFEYFLSESQWVDLVSETREAAFARLAAVFAGAGMPRAAPPPLAAVPPALATRRARPSIGWALGAVLVAGLLALGGVFLTRSGPTVPPTPPTPPASSATSAPDKSIAVLPFTDMSQGRDQEFFADGMAEQILDLLAKIPSLKVIARTSSFQFKGKSEDARVVGEKLGVATLLEGSVRKSGDRMRVTAQLIRAADGSHLWSEVYDRQVSDVFRTQDEIAGAVVSALRVSLLGTPEQRAAPTTNTEAYTLYLEALASYNRYTAADVAAAQDQARRAVALDPNFAAAWSLLAAAYASNMVFGTAEGFEKTRQQMTEAAHHALALDAKLPGPYVTLANSFFLDLDYSGSQRELKTALELAPNDPDALSLAAYLAIASCHLDEAERDARQLIQRDPLSIDPYRTLGTTLWFRGQLAESEAVYRRVIALSPGAESMRYRLSLVLLSAERPQEALEVAQAEPDPSWRGFGTAMALDALGRRTEADAVLARLVKDPVASVAGAYQVAVVYAHRGDREGAFRWLERARKGRDPGFSNYLKCDPDLKGLRGDARYQAMLAALNLPP
jgi:TolB-like protein/tetratricopeptide (TPR) repeat protein